MIPAPTAPFQPATGLLASLDLLQVSQADAVLHLRLNRPAKRNAISDALIGQIHTAFLNLPADVRAVVVSGAGDHFCAGLDLSELVERDIHAAVLHSRGWHAAFDAIQYGRVPVVSVLHGAVVRGVRIAQNRLVPSGAVITTQAQADALPLKAEANSEFQNDVLDVNAEFAEGYIEQYKVGGLDAVSGVTVAPKTTWNPRPVKPTLGQGVSVEEFVRIVGDVRLGANSSVGRRSSIRADEGAPIIIGANSSIEDQVTFHALKGTTIVIGSGLNASDNIVFHGPLTVGNNLTIGDDSVVFRSKIGNNVTIGENALVIDVTLPDGAVVPDGARILKQADADALKK